MTKIMKALIATPKIKDLFFFKSIILLTQMNKNSIYGLILNNVMDERVTDIWEVVNPEAKIHKNNKLRIGGPLYGAVCVIHKIKKYSEQELFPKTFLSIKPSNIEKILSSKTKPYEMYVGYCSWTPSQLAKEIMEGNWWESEVSDDMIFGDNFNYWDTNKQYQNKLLLEKLEIKNQNYLFN